MESYNDAVLFSLISLAKENDDAAFSELIERYTPMMNKVIASFYDSRFRYDEAFSEACYALHRAAISYDLSRSDDVTFGLYAKICIHRRLCDFVEKLGREVGVTVDVDVENLSTDSNIEQRIVGRERMAEYLKKARGLLSEYEYRVFMLYINGDSTAEIAKKLGKDVKSVENAKSRMLRHLRSESDIFSDV